jgi:hypothetical protein
VSEPTLTEFLLARIAEDEVVARAAADKDLDRWAAGGGVEAEWRDGMDPDLNTMIAYDEGRPTEAQAEHIARHDPARVLAECAAKRRIVEMHEAAVNHDEMCGWPCETLLALAAVYADNPEFRDEWRWMVYQD